VIYYEGHSEIANYMRFLSAELPKLPLDARVRRALAMRRPENVYWSVLENGKLALFNFNDAGSLVHLAGNREIRLEPYQVKLVDTADGGGGR
jgi:hypothetical protein